MKLMFQTKNNEIGFKMIEIYGNQTCPYCLRAKRAAQMYGLEYTWLDTDLPENKQTLMEKLPDAKTIPQIWWHGRHVGGYAEFANEIENTVNGFGDGKL